MIMVFPRFDRLYSTSNNNTSLALLLARVVSARILEDTETLILQTILELKYAQRICISNRKVVYKVTH